MQWLSRYSLTLLSVLCLTTCRAGITSINPNKLTDAEKRTKWTVVEDVPAGDYFAIHGLAADDIYIVGRAGKILHYDGKELTEVESPTTENLFAVHVRSGTRAYAAGAHGTIIAWDGTSWKLEDSNTQEEIRGLWADDDMALAVGANAVALARYPAGWQAVPVMTPENNPSPDDLLALVKGNGNPFAVGTLGSIAQFNGTIFRRTALGGYPKTLAAATSGPGGTFMGGVDGAVFRGNARINGLQASFVRGISAPDPDAVFVVGWDGLFAKVRSDGTIVPYPDAGTTWLYGIFSASLTDVWVVGADGLILRGPPPVDPPSQAAP